MKDKRSEWRRWFEQALRDLDDAKFNFSGKRFNVACFLAQQSAEKAIKSFLFFKGAKEVWRHSVSELWNDASAKRSLRERILMLNLKIFVQKHILLINITFQHAIPMLCQVVFHLRHLMKLTPREPYHYQKRLLILLEINLR